MRFRNIFWGMILVFLGIVLTLNNLNVIDFSWYNLWRLWPVILVLWGISIIPVKNLIKSILVLLVLGASVVYVSQESEPWNDHEYNFSFNDYDDHDDDGNLNQEFNIPFEDSLSFASLDMEIAASTFTLVDESFDLIDFEKHGSMINYKYTTKQVDSSVKINIYTDESTEFKSHNHNKVNLALNPYPVWDLGFEIGAADANFDLSGLKISKLTIEGGAAAIAVKLGDNYAKTEVKIPKEVYCELDITSVLSGKTISGFEKVDRGSYKTDNYNEATSRIYITVETAVSNYSIIRY